MNIRCPGCNATLKYSPDLGKMYCGFCGNTYAPEEVGYEQNETAADSGFQESVKMQKRHNSYIKMQLQHCTSCGAELAMSNVEVSSFCAYCGQATIVKDRIDDYLKPDYIIPFKVTKEEALKTLKHNARNGIFIPGDLSNIQIDRLCGIYIPFWLYDIYCEDEQMWQIQTSNNYYIRPLYYFRVARAYFANFSVDASIRLADETSIRLEPYDKSELIPFDPAYLSGFYSDRFDVNSLEGRQVAKSRIEDAILARVKRTLQSKNGVLTSRDSKMELEAERYVLLPAWFLTFRYNNKPYTILVNGQSGKMVGAFPFSKRKIFLIFCLFAILFSLIFTKLLSTNPVFMAPNIFTFSCFGIAFLAKTSYRKFKNVLQSLNLTRSVQTQAFVTDRQEE